MKSNGKMTYKIALAGNPNVGKSTVFNCLTGMHQHTGNWAGKTVQNAKGKYTFKDNDFEVMDLPGTYSLYSRSYEETCAEEYITFSQCNAVVVVADGNCLLRNLNLFMQIKEITPNVILAVNLMDEATKNGVAIDFTELRNQLGVQVVPMSAGKKEGIRELKEAVLTLCKNPNNSNKKISAESQNNFEKEVNDKIAEIESHLEKNGSKDYRNRYFALRLIYDMEYSRTLFKNKPYKNQKELLENVEKIIKEIYNILGSKEKFCDYLIKDIENSSKEICKICVKEGESKYKKRLKTLDRVFMGKFTGSITMILLLLLVLWITIYGANYPSQLLADLLLGFEDTLANFFLNIGVSEWLVNMMIHGGYNVLAWVVSVMLPPMAIFFPMFTLLEDFGYLPRVAFNLDYYFNKANTCGKQSLTMCMGFGCNAVGVMGCRIIDSQRERLIAMITNAFVPCNGRFPTLIAIISMFFLAGATGFFGSLMSAFLLCLVLIFGILSTFVVSKILSKTLLKGMPSSFTLEMPPYRKPQFGKVIIRSIFDRTLFVLGRAVAVAAPAGLVIWIFANVIVGDKTLLCHITDFLDPLGKIMGMDGVILTAFLLGLPANEIVIPVMLMTYMQESALCDFSSLVELRELLVANGWTMITAICVMVFCLMHWPCSTTLLTIKKETKSNKWTLISFLVPTICGAVVCILINLVGKIFI